MSSVLFFRCLPFTIKLHFPSFIFSPLSSSASHRPPLTVISDFLTKECGFSSPQLTTVMRRRPELLRNKSDQTAREVINLLKDSGFTENKVKGMILRAPGILSLRADRQLWPKMEFLKEAGLSTQDIAHIISCTPRLLELNLENSLAPRLLHLETLFGSRVHLCKALRSAPELLVRDFKNQVIPRVEYVKNKLGILEGSAAFKRALDVVLGLTLENLEKKTIHMLSLGLAEDEISQILKTHPEALRTSTKKMTENIDFLIRTAGLEPKIVALDPVLLNLSVEKRFKPRYEVFKSLRTSPRAKNLPSLVRFFRLSEQKFLKYYGQYSSKSSPAIILSPKPRILEQ